MEFMYLFIITENNPVCKKKLGFGSLSVQANLGGNILP
jgi:hypothetical protein